MKLPITLPFDDFISLAVTMFESNPLAEVRVWLPYGTDNSDIHTFRSAKEIRSLVWRDEITITSIEVRQPHFRLDDVVMIVDTWEIGKIDWTETIYRSWFVDFFMIWWKYYARDRLVKVPSDLLHKLQD
jgi:hypothetical protein